MLAATVVGLLRRSKASGHFGRTTACLAQLLDAPGAGPPSCIAGRPFTSSSNAYSPLENFAGDCSQADRAHHGVWSPRLQHGLHNASLAARAAVPDTLPWEDSYGSRLGDGAAPVPRPPPPLLDDPNKHWDDAPRQLGRRAQRRGTQSRRIPWRLAGNGPEVDPDAPLTGHERQMLSALAKYRDTFGDSRVPSLFWEHPELGKWCSMVRKNAKAAYRMTRALKQALDGLGFPWRLSIEEADWDFSMHELRRYREEFQHTNVPFKWRDPTYDFSNNFAKWFHAQPTLFRQRRLSLAQVEKLKLAGLDVRTAANEAVDDKEYLEGHTEVEKSSSMVEFDVMFAELRKWNESFGSCNVPKQVWDNPVLGMWVHRVRRDKKNELLPAWQASALDGLGFEWKVHQQVAKWFFNLHEARRWKEEHGHGMIPADYYNPEERNWVEAARWLHRQARLFGKGRLSEDREEMIRKILGVKFQRHVTGKSAGLPKTRKTLHQPEKPPPVGRNTMQVMDTRLLSKKQKGLVQLHKREMKLKAVGRK